MRSQRKHKAGRGPGRLQVGRLGSSCSRQIREPTPKEAGRGAMERSLGRVKAEPSRCAELEETRQTLWEGGAGPGWRMEQNLCVVFALDLHTLAGMSFCS